MLASLLLPAGWVVAPVSVTGQESESPTAPAVVSGLTVLASIDRDGSARMELRYRMRNAAAASSLPVRGLAFGGAPLEDVSIRVDGEPSRLEWADRSLPLLLGSVAIARQGGLSDDATVAMHYVVPAGPDTGDVRMPILLLDLPPEGAPEGFFTARVTLPSGMAIAERFPTVPIVAVADEPDTYELSLPATPSVLRVRLSPDRPGMTFAARVDTAVVFGLLLLALVAWRRYRSSEAP